MHHFATFVKRSRGLRYGRTYVSALFVRKAFQKFKTFEKLVGREKTYWPNDPPTGYIRLLGVVTPSSIA